MLEKEVIDRFFRHVNKRGDNECWEWRAVCNEHGSGIFNPYGSGSVASYKFYYELLNGKINVNEVVLHTCGNPSCVNPKHLYKMDKFWAKVNKKGEDECWEWNTTSVGNSGYGYFKFKGINTSSHRVAYELTYGKIPYGRFVLHKCDNKLCCNPKHLFLGDNFSNMADKVRRGRCNIPNQKGESNSNAKLTAKDVRLIRQLYKEGMSRKELSIKFKTASIYNITSGKSWKGV